MAPRGMSDHLIEGRGGEGEWGESPRTLGGLPQYLFL
jgi:hypothetical protein